MTKKIKISFLSLSALILLSGCSRNEDLLGNLDPYQFISDKYKKVENYVANSFNDNKNKELNYDNTPKGEYKSIDLPEDYENKFQERYVNQKKEAKTDLEKKLTRKIPKTRRFTINEVELRDGFNGYPYRIIEINTGEMITGLIFSSQTDVIKSVGDRQVLYTKYDYFVKVENGIPVEFNTSYTTPIKNTTMTANSQMKFSSDILTKYNDNCSEFVDEFEAKNVIQNGETIKFEYKNNTFYKNSVELALGDPYLPGLEKSLDTICIDATKRLFNIY